MKYVFFIFSIILWSSCNNDILENIDNDKDIVTRTSSLDNYYFGTSSNTPLADIVVNNKGVSHQDYYTILSYQQVGATFTDIEPQILSTPSWISIECRHVYYKIYVIFITVEVNTSNERTGLVQLVQPGSNKTLSIRITQSGTNNNVTIGVNSPCKNQYEFVATTNYPVEDNIRIQVPFIVYNDNGEMSQNAIISIVKGQKTGSYVMDYSGSPLVYYHGDLKGYRLYEGQISGDSTYVYSFTRYW